MKQYDEEEMILRQLTKGSNPYQAPQGYFDKLPGMVMQKVSARQGTGGEQLCAGLWLPS